ncbi:MetQ/NlpA family ABC transporter substrate-binding protein [Natronoglycomyces albus]|uniref:Lipoprotein n=1 Tax=Natronoglycomyces albus TaxID=2811108 RepID=A0A895XRA2_9ACTN|nr:MetQ/NlpA family ABC transporter substrate-binding protein [Natronoglycomyces albus]QSB06053.1 MetQ/NlpA family ABC transporter substrate-binding protein [Natronoglycomyces albus]
MRNPFSSRRLLTTGAITASTLLALAACGNGGGAASEDESDPLIVGASPRPHVEILEFVQENLAADAGLELDIRPFTDYITPNTAVQDGDINANFFQHQPYLEDFNAENDTDLIGVAAVHIEPLGLFSAEYDAVADISEGDQIAIPSDASNGGRALALLESAGLLELAEDAGSTATVDDITENPFDLDIEPIEAAQLPRALDDVDAAVINGNYAIEADLSPAEDALFLEEGDDNPYANLLVVLDGNEDDERIVTLAQLLTSDEVKQFIEENWSDGSILPAS